MITVVACYHPKTKEFVGWLPPNAPIPKDLPVRSFEIDDDEFNIRRWKHKGNYDNGEIIDTFLGIEQTVVAIEDIYLKHFAPILKKLSTDTIITSFLYFCSTGKVPTFLPYSDIQEAIKKAEEELEMYKQYPNDYIVVPIKDLNFFEKKFADVAKKI